MRECGSVREKEWPSSLGLEHLEESSIAVERKKTTKRNQESGVRDHQRETQGG